MSRSVTLLLFASALVLAAPVQAQTKLTAANAANANFLGAHVAISDDGLRAVAAAPLSDAGGATDTGALYVFSRSEGGAWGQEAVLTAADAVEFDNLGTWTNANPLNGGSPLAISGDGTRIAAGALFADISGNVDQGAVYVFVRGSDGTWAQEAKLTGAATLFTQFGFSVDLDENGDRMIVGARFDDLGSADTNEGRAYVFDRSGGTWSETARLTAETPAPADFFGASVSISDDGETAVVGAPLDDTASISDPANNDVGSVYVFTRAGDGSWAQQARLEAAAPAVADNLGYSVAVGGGRIAAGAFLREVNGNVDAGAVYVFSDDGGTWTQDAVLTGSGASTATFANLGVQVDIDDSGRRVLAGAPLDDFVGDQNEGRAYVFTRSDDGTWAETRVLSETPTPGAVDFFGASVALSGDAETAVAGAVFDDNPAVTDPANNDQGAAFVFDLTALPTATVVDGPQGTLSISTVYPNPLRGAGHVEVTLAETGTVSAALYNTLGQRVTNVFEGVVVGGQARALHVLTDELATGVYVLRVQAGGAVATQRLVVVR